MLLCGERSFQALSKPVVTLGEITHEFGKCVVWRFQQLAYQDKIRRYGVLAAQQSAIDSRTCGPSALVPAFISILVFLGAR